MAESPAPSAESTSLRSGDDHALNDVVGVITALTALVFPSFALFDYLLGGQEALLRALPVRLSAGTFFGVLFVVTRLPFARRAATAAFHATLTGGAAFVMALSARIDDPLAGRLGGVMFLVLALAAIATRLRQAVLQSVLFLAVILVTQSLLGTPAGDRLFLFAIVVPALAVACVLVLRRERTLQATFAIEQALKSQRAAFEVEARTDALTGIANRRAFLAVANTAVAGAKRYGRDLSILVVDIDLFKRVNDEHGHAAGDAVLTQLARSIGVVLRSADLLGRLGGEEFGVLLPETGTAGAAIAAERVRAVVAAARVHHEGKVLRITVSVGVATLDRSESLDALQSRADRALYAAKDGGRDRVGVAPAPAAEPLPPPDPAT